MTRQAAGWKANRAGQGWEDALAVYHKFLASQGLAIVNKTGPEVTFVKGRGGRVEPLVVGPGVADYVGTLSNGTFVGFEAKSTSDTSGYSLPAKSLHQLYWLETVQAISGGRASVFYIVLYRAMNETRLHRIRDILPGKRIRRPDGILLPDGISWYDALWQLEKVT